MSVQDMSKQEEVKAEIEEVCDAHGLTCYVGDYGYGMTYTPKESEYWQSSDCYGESSEGRWVSSSDNC